MPCIFSFFRINQLNIKFKFTHPNSQIFGQKCDNMRPAKVSSKTLALAKVWRYINLLLTYNKTRIAEDSCYKQHIVRWTHSVLYRRSLPVIDALSRPQLDAPTGRILPVSQMH